MLEEDLVIVLAAYVCRRSHRRGSCQDACLAGLAVRAFFRIHLQVSLIRWVLRLARLLWLRLRRLLVLLFLLKEENEPPRHHTQRLLQQLIVKQVLLLRLEMLQNVQRSAWVDFASLESVIQWRGRLCHLLVIATSAVAITLAPLVLITRSLP